MTAQDFITIAQAAANAPAVDIDAFYLTLPKGAAIFTAPIALADKEKGAPCSPGKNNSSR